MAATKKFVAVEPIEHDGVRHEPGQSIELSDEQAAPLLQLGHIALPASKKAAADEQKA
jgi:hypothetical protein